MYVNWTVVAWTWCIIFGLAVGAMLYLMYELREAGKAREKYIDACEKYIRALKESCDANKLWALSEQRVAGSLKEQIELVKRYCKVKGWYIPVICDDNGDKVMEVNYDDNSKVPPLD